jgi:hypothetical protein
VKDGFVWLMKEWKTGDVVEISIRFAVMLEKTQDETAWYFRRGSLTFAHPFDAHISKVSENPHWLSGEPTGLCEYAVDVADASRWGSRIDPSERFEFVRLPGDILHPLKNSVVGLRGRLIDSEGNPIEVRLVPQAAAVSRRVTFLDISHPATEAAKVASDREVSIGN